MKKVFLSLLVGILLTFQAFADDISKYIKKTDFEIGSKVSLYVINQKTNDVIYKKNIYEELNPASIMKLISFASAYQVLGSEYEFKTSIFKDAKNNFYIKLGADVLLKQEDLIKLVAKIKTQKINQIYIDDSIFAQEKYPSSWKDEDKWPHYSEITPYIVDNNMAKIAIHRSALSKRVEIIQDDNYRFSIINELKIGDNHKIEIKRLYGENSPIINLQGEVSRDSEINLAVLNPQINFINKFRYALEKNDIVYLKTIKTSKVPQNALEVAYVSHNISQISKLILHNSNNFASEVVSKVAAAKYINYQREAIFADEISMINSIFSPYFSTGDVIADSSGVSRENKLCVKTISYIFSKILQDEQFRNMLVSANQGTLSQRLIFLSGNLKAKTGTLRNYSSICANFTTRNNNDIILVSIVQDSSKRKGLLKDYENRLIGLIYKKY